MLQRSVSFVWTLVLVGAAAAPFGCKKKESAPQPAAPAAAPAAAPKAAPAPSPAVSGPLADALRKAGTCNPTDLSFSYKCEAYKAVSKAIDDASKAGGPVKALETLAALAADADANVAKIAAFATGDSATVRVVDAIARGKLAFPATVVDGVVAALGKQAGPFAVRLATVGANLAPLAGKLDAFKSAFTAHADPYVAPAALRSLMRYGRLAALPMVEDAVKSGAKPEHRRAASAAPLEMYSWTPDEKAKLCPLGKAWLADADLEIAGNGAHILARCKGEYVDVMLEEGKRRADKGEWKKPFLWAYRDICFKGFFGSDAIPDDAVCQKVYDFLEWVGKNEKVGNWERGFALDMIYYQQRNEKTIKRLRKYTKSKVAEIAKFTTEAIESIKKHYLKK